MDNILKEIVCTQYAISATTNELQKTYDFTVPIDFEAGEVLIDSLGRGSFQKTQGVTK